MYRNKFAHRMREFLLLSKDSAAVTKIIYNSNMGLNLLQYHCSNRIPSKARLLSSSSSSSSKLRNTSNNVVTKSGMRPIRSKNDIAASIDSLSIEISTSKDSKECTSQKINKNHVNLNSRRVTEDPSSIDEYNMLLKQASHDKNPFLAESIILSMEQDQTGKFYFNTKISLL